MPDRRLSAFHFGAVVELDGAGALTIRPARGAVVRLDAAATAAIVAALGAPHWRPRLNEVLTAATPTGRIAVAPIAPVSPEAVA